MDAPADLLVVVTGANGLVGSRVCAALAGRGARVRAVVRRPGTAPGQDGVEEVVGDFTDAEQAATIVAGAEAVVTTVHPMGSNRATQHAVGVDGTATIARAAREAHVERLVHISTAAVYDRSPAVGDVDESSALVGDDAGDYAVTKRDAERALAGIEGLTVVLVRPPAILGTSESSVWNTLRPRAMRDDQGARHALPDQTFGWVHVDDLAAFVTDVALGRVPTAPDPQRGPAAGRATAVTVAGGPATLRQYVATVADAVGVDPVWDKGPSWTGVLLTDRARGWGFTPRVTLEDALREVARDARS